MNNLAFASIKTLQQLLAKKEISHKELLYYFLKRFTTLDPHLRTALEIFDGESILNASASTGPLAGIPGILKDNIAQSGRILSCASRILENFRSPYDATVSARLKEAGALLIGRANMDEFAMGSSTETSAYYKTKNPWNPDRVPGGSSGGSIAAVAAGLTPWALGSETGGSVRLPAAFCGIVGLKPTYGLISRYGLVAYASSLDQIGIATRTVEDNALILSSIAGQDSNDATTLAIHAKDYTRHLTESFMQNLKIGIVDNMIDIDGIDKEISHAVKQAIQHLEQLGAHIEHISLPSLEYSAAAYFIISRAEAASNLARFDGIRYGIRNQDGESLADLYRNTRHDGFGQEVKKRIIIGNYVLSTGHAGEFYGNAKKVQQLIRTDFIEAFKKVHLLIMPTQSAPAFRFGSYDQDKLKMDLQDYFTCSINLAGVPALSLPCGFTTEGLPIGFQLIGPHLSEELLYHVAHHYEQSTPWHTHHPLGY